MRKITGIYKITSPSGRVYIGQSYNIRERFSRYRNLNCRKQPLIYRSLMKYGPENHKYEVIHELIDGDINQAALDYWECFYMEKYKTKGFVLLNAREGGSRGKLSDKSKILIKEKRSRQVCTPETRAKMSLSGKALKKKISEEHKKKISLANSGSNNKMYGKKLSNEHKQKLIEGRREKGYARGELHPKFGRKLSPETIMKMKGKNGKWMKGRKMSPESVQKMVDKISKPVSQFSNDLSFIKAWESSAKAERELNIKHIRACVRGERKSAGGFKWFEYTIFHHLTLDDYKKQRNLIK